MTRKTKIDKDGWAGGKVGTEKPRKIAKLRKPQTLLSDRFLSLSALSCPSYPLSSWQNMVGGFLVESHDDCHCHVSKCWDFQREAGRGWSEPSHPPPQTLSSVNSRQSRPKVVSKLSQSCIKVLPKLYQSSPKCKSWDFQKPDDSGCFHRIHCRQRISSVNSSSKVGPINRCVVVGDDGVVISCE